ncbi:MAG: hypothetical protein PHQ27_09495 [Victivallales bacterium]|nr:hypothetical protein [Victivallales bacterium]
MIWKSSFLAIIIGLGCLLAPAPKASAMDPVTIALLAPVAIQAGKTLYPYVARGAANAGKGMVAMGMDTISVFRLPLGLLQCTVLAPFGGLSSGATNVVKGGIAPLKLGMHAAMLPLNMFGVPVIASGW